MALRSDELTAIQEALTIMTSERAMAVFNTGLLQMPVVTHVSLPDPTEPSVSLVQVQASTGFGGPFDKVNWAQIKKYKYPLLHTSTSCSFSAVSTPTFASKCSLVTRCYAKQDDVVLRCMSPCSVCIKDFFPLKILRISSH